MLQVKEIAKMGLEAQSQVRNMINIGIKVSNNVSSALVGTTQGVDVYGEGFEQVYMHPIAAQLTKTNLALMKVFRF